MIFILKRTQIQTDVHQNYVYKVGESEYRSLFGNRLLAGELDCY